jgi:hypothetical protein
VSTEKATTKDTKIADPEAKDDVSEADYDPTVPFTGYATKFPPVTEAPDTEPHAKAKTSDE